MMQQNTQQGQDISPVKRVFLIVLDSVGIGELPDAAAYGDGGSHTLRSCWNTGELELPTLRRLGLYNIEGIGCGEPDTLPLGAFARMREASNGKDTTIGHWEIAGLCSKTPFPTYPNGFPAELLQTFSRLTGRGILCNQPYSGTQVLRDYGMEHLETGKWIVYTSADSVFQLAAHEEKVPLSELYSACETARRLLQGEHAVGRVIARPFVGNTPEHFRRTSNRHDFSLVPPRPTMLDFLQKAGMETIGIGKINDIFAGRGIAQSVHTADNEQGMDAVIQCAKADFTGLCFVNLVDFDMLYGHRNDVTGYTHALNRFDRRLAQLLPLLGKEDVLLITADHGCDPATPSTDHSREYTPLLAYGGAIRPRIDLSTRNTFADIGATVLALLGVSGEIEGDSLLPLWKNEQ